MNNINAFFMLYNMYIFLCILLHMISSACYAKQCVCFDCRVSGLGVHHLSYSHDIFSDFIIGLHVCSHILSMSPLLKNRTA